MQTPNKTSCPDCEPNLSRREFVQAVGGAALAAGVFPRFASAAPKAGSPAETAVAQLYKSLTEKQREEICFPFDHERRRTINANWHVTEPGIASEFYTKDQQALIHEILKGVTSEDGYERFLKQMESDTKGGLAGYNVGLFGEPGTGEFQCMVTGRHLTLRADGDSVKNAAFGGPIVYGHGQGDPKKNLFHYQTQKANEVFQALDEDQRKLALLEKAPQEAAVQLQGEKGRFKGITVGELSADQKELVESVIKIILAPYRKDDVEESLSLLKEGGGLDGLHMAFYQQGDLNNDQVWDIWRMEGPTFVWHFRGAPHVHTYVNIGKKA
jgi:hypothetical protein